MREELLRPEELGDEVEISAEASLRPRTLAEFVGQPELKGHLEIILEAARRRSQAVDHVLLAGPPGLGKTSLAAIIAAEMGVAINVTSGPAIERAGDLAAMLSQLGEGDVLFIDEIHRLPRVVEEVLYPAMEDFQIDIVLGKGPRRALDPARSAPLHARRSHHPHGIHHRSAPRPLRSRRAARLLRKPRTSSTSSPVPQGSSACRSTPRAPGRSLAGLAARRGSPTDSCGASATSRR